jgi:hypothetical protein
MGKYKGAARKDKERKRLESEWRLKFHNLLTKRGKLIKSSRRRGLSLKETIRNMFPDITKKHRQGVIDEIREKTWDDYREMWDILYGKTGVMPPPPTILSVQMRDERNKKKKSGFIKGQSRNWNKKYMQ